MGEHADSIAFLIALLGGYLIGSIPFGLILTRAAGLGDIRSIGSGNIGATNVLRTGRKGLAAATLILDGAKGAVAVLLARHFLPEAGADGAMIAGAAAMIGHCYPVWLKFRGGKGVATLLGLSLALAWPIGLIFALVWLGMGADGHIASLFPNIDPRVDDPLRVRRLTPDPLPPEAPFDRVTLTIPALLDSEELAFVIRGEAKRALFEQAMAGGNDLPVARLLGAARQPVTCFA